MEYEASAKRYWQEKLIVYLGDNLLQDGIKGYAAEFSSHNCDAMILLKEVEDPSKFGVAEIDGEGGLVKLVEKPKTHVSNYALIGAYFLTPKIFPVIKRLKPSRRGEYEITDALQGLIDEGCNVEYRIVKGWWFDTGKKDDVLTVNVLILDERGRRIIEGSVENSKIEGRVTIGKGTEIVDSVVRGPAVIGEDCHVERSLINPYTNIGDRVKILNSSVEYSIVMDDSTIEGVDRIQESLIGRNSKIVKSGKGKFYRFHIANHSELTLSTAEAGRLAYSPFDA
jgi:glucose-1-phosphate thymidylyltransferase